MSTEDIEKLANPKTNKEVLEFLNSLQKIAQGYGNKLDKKLAKVQEMTSIMDTNKSKVSKEIDDYFDLLIAILNNRRDQLKSEYIQLEQSHRKRVIQSSLKLKALAEELTHAAAEIDLGISDFESDLAYTANRALYKSAYNRLNTLRSHISEPTYIKKTQYKPPEFKHLPGDSTNLAQIGKVIDNVDHQQPLCTINVTNFAMYYYNIYKNIWFKFTVDPEEVRLKKIPKYFKYAHLGEDKYVLLGGFDVDLNTSSNKAFLFQGGHFTRADSMITPRQYFGVAVDDTFVYAVAGFNSEEGVIGKCERMHIQTKKWEEIEPLNVPRMNTAAIRIGEKYVYIFGGQSDKGFLDSIERYNLDLNIWTLLDVSLPTRVSNLTVLQASNSTLILLGGLKYVRKIITEGEREREEYRPEIDKNAYFFDLFKQELIVRLFCQFKKKLQSAQVNGKGHIYCLYMNNNRELPHLFIADLNEVYPDYSPYSWMLRLGYREKKLEKISLSKSNSELEAEPKNVQSVELIELKGEYKP